MCTTCLDVSLDAAYTNGFKIDEDEYEYVEDFDEPFTFDQLDVFGRLDQ